MQFMQLNRKALDEVKTREDTEAVTSPRAKRRKAEGDQVVQNDQSLSLSPNPDFGAGSSSVEGVEGALEEDLRSHVDFATLATDPQQLTVRVPSPCLALKPRLDAASVIALVLQALLNLQVANCKRFQRKSRHGRMSEILLGKAARSLIHKPRSILLPTTT